MAEVPPAAQVMESGSLLIPLTKRSIGQLITGAELPAVPVALQGGGAIGCWRSSRSYRALCLVEGSLCLQLACGLLRCCPFLCCLSCKAPQSLRCEEALYKVIIMYPAKCPFDPRDSAVSGRSLMNSDPDEGLIVSATACQLPLVSQ